MNPLKPIAIKKSAKRERQKKVLLGVVELYILTAKPIGSNTLRENGFHELSSATIRNYFVGLEEEGYLSQQHSSGGRIPTHKALRLYAREVQDFGVQNKSHKEVAKQLMEEDPTDVAAYLQRCAEKLSQHSHCAVFLSAPRFDQDFIRDIRLVALDDGRCLCALMTDFGLVHTEVLQMDTALEEESLKRLEAHFRARFRSDEAVSQDELSESERAVAHNWYHEVMVRYIVGYANYSHEDITCTGFSQLLRYPEFSDIVTLTSSLALFESPQSMRHLLRECSAVRSTKFWIGNDLKSCLPTKAECAVIAAPYSIHQSPVGAIGLLGPARLPYRELFGVLEACTEVISEALTKTLYKHKISYRSPSQDGHFLNEENGRFVEDAVPILLEDKRET